MVNDIDSDLKNPYAEQYSPDSGDIVSPDQAIYGNTYYCPDPNCRDPNRRLFIKQKTRKFFSHYPGYNHLYPGETLLHKLAIKYFKDLESFELPSLNGEEARVIIIDSTKTELEYTGFKSLRPDITVTTLEGEIYCIEIFVTHETKGQKLDTLKDYELPTIEIKLNDFYDLYQGKCKTDVDFVRNSVPDLISNMKLKAWLYHPEMEMSETTSIEEQQSGAKPKEPLKSESSVWSLNDKLKMGAVGAIVLLVVSPSLRKSVWKKIMSVIGF